MLVEEIYNKNNLKITRQHVYERYEPSIYVLRTDLYKIYLTKIDTNYDIIIIYNILNNNKIIQIETDENINFIHHNNLDTLVSANQVNNIVEQIKRLALFK